ncbi:BQ5605_C003g01878 [Microbotryum silenes-dioicae]|uniref:BQ5605_C003g01878 protein n=1 Tax=Microbotryum silenes-dioicae TaxID=796604 RepID=A0A2X0M003_9BASI|nr:BQ5605_C003g01878 [Microbotryum silenes-dioicae]
MGLFAKKKKELIPEVDPSGFNGANASYSNAPSRGGGGGPSSSYQGSIAPSEYSTAAPSYRTQGAGSYLPPSQGGAGYGAYQSHYSRPQPGSGAPPPQGGAAYGPGAGGAGLSQAGAPAQGVSSFRDRFAKKNPGRGEANPEARNELLAGAPHPQQQQQPNSSRPYGGGAYGVDGREDDQPLDEDEEVEGIKQQMRFVKQESLASSRNAVRIAREAEETARATLDKLGDQSDRIANTERHLDLAKAHNDRAQDETKELMALNRSIFRPNITFNKQAKRDRDEARIIARHNAEKDERELVRREQYESHQRIDQTYHSMDRKADDAARARQRAKARGAERGRYQFEATASDDEVEDEIDGNLDELSGLAGRLKMLATTAGQEVDAQNTKLSKLGNKVDVLDTNVVRSTQRLARVK